jgi:polysaccharide deacetylase 2 family uncharacterized protein YibQ
MPRTRRRSAGKRTSLVLLGAGVIVAGLVLGALIPGCRSAQQTAPESAPPPASLPAPAPTPVPVPAPLPPAKPPVVQPKPPDARVPAGQEIRARVAIIFDDAGGSLTDLDAIIALRRPVVVSVLPGLRYSREVAERARAAGLEVFLHLPLEPEDASKALGPGGITAGMSDEEIAAVVREDLDNIPGAVGVNNHMGSKGTADERIMRVVLSVVRERRLIFVDSVTSSRSIAARRAAEMGIPTAARAVFLDNEDEPAAIRAELLRLIALARQRGEVIAIGHTQRQTAKVLLSMLDEFEKQGVKIVPISTLVH